MHHASCISEEGGVARPQDDSLRLSAPRAGGQPMARRGVEIPDRVYKWLMVLPAVVTVLALSLFPMLVTFGATFTDWHLFRHGDPVSFVGLENWGRLLHDSHFQITARNTIVYTLGVVPGQYLIGLIVALALNSATRGQKFFRVFFFLPMMMSPVAVAFIIGRTIFHEDVGPLNDLLYRLGLPAVRWLTDAKMAMVTVILVDIWHWTSFMVLMLLAGLQSLPQDPYEAAKVEGASEWQLFRHITFPLLFPITVTAILIRTLDAFKVVDTIRVITGGGPGQATESITLAVYDLGVKGGDIAYGSTAAYGLLIVMMLFSAVIVLATRRWVTAAN
jgi:multiple sugar transport system permease protein